MEYLFKYIISQIKDTSRTIEENRMKLFFKNLIFCPLRFSKYNTYNILLRN